MARIGYNTGYSAHRIVNTNRQAQQFILLNHILKDAGLTAKEVSSCMQKYVATLSRGRLASLTQHLPKVQAIDGSWQPTDENIAQLSHNGRIDVEVVVRTARKAQLQFVKQPGSAHGEKSWLRELLHALARSTTTTSSKQDVWNTNPDSAIWLAIMSRAQIILSSSQWADMVPQATRDAYHNGWLLVFGLHRKAAVPGATATIAVLTKGFFAAQTSNAAYRAMLQKLPRLAANRAQKLSQYGEAVPATSEKPVPTTNPTASPVQPPKESTAVQKGEKWNGWAAMPKPEANAGKPVGATREYDSEWPKLG
jgi:hypothetical protein